MDDAIGLVVVIIIVIYAVVHSSAWPVIVAVFHFLLFAVPIFFCARFLYRRRVAIARWYYFTFHPHPAEPAIRSALAEGSVLDGKALATVLGEPPSGNAIFRAVRAAQTDALIGEMQAMTRAQMRELEERAEEGYQRAAVQQMQAALADAAVALEQAKTFLNTSRGIDP